jgi:glucan phosphoethanolaminetransferase (alkaline phosphatase superfamily)
MRYSLKIWGFTVIIPPLVMISTAFLMGDRHTSNLVMFVLMLFFGFLILFPAIVIFYLLNRYYTGRVADVRRKIILSIYAVIVMFLYAAIDPPANPAKFDFLTFPLLYSAAMIISIWLFKEDI